MTVAIVTDSAACLPAEEAGPLGLSVVPLSVVIDAERRDAVPPGAEPDGQLAGPGPVTTASPAPQRFAAVYAAAARDADEIVSIHLSGSLSGTVNSASLAAAGAPVPVRVVDSRTIGLGLGYAVLAAAAAARDGAGAAQVAAAATARAAAARVFFTVTSGGHLIAGGRMAAPAGPDRTALALAAPALAAQAVLHLPDGRVALLDKVRTRSAARRRLADLAVAAAGGQPADLAVHYLGPDGPATELASTLATLIPAARQIRVSRGDAAIAAHAGPGMLGVVVVPGDCP